MGCSAAHSNTTAVVGNSKKDCKMPKFQQSARVRIQNPASCQHERFGSVIGFAAESNSYLVDLDGQFVEVAEEHLRDATFDWGQK